MTNQKALTTPQEIDNKLDEIRAFLNSQSEQKILDQTPTPKVRSIEILYETKTLKKQEVSLLETATIRREAGLVLLRQNKMEEGKTALDVAKQMVADNEICEEGQLITSTYQSAAESFLYLKQKDFDTALRLMKAALEFHRALFLAYGHPIAERRIHLSSNYAKVLVISGKQVDSFKLVTQLVTYIFTEEDNWPVDYCAVENLDKISVATTMHVLNQILKTVGGILLKSKHEEIWKLFDDLINALEQSKDSEVTATLSWCKAIKAMQNNDEITFLNNALCFFQNEKSLLPSAKKHLLTMLNTNFVSSKQRSI